MRTTFSSVAILASSLLAREVMAAPHMHNHKRAVVTDIVIITDMVTVTADSDGTYETASPVPIGTTTIAGVPVVVVSTPVATPTTTEAPAQAPASEAPASETPSSSSSESSGAVFIQVSSSIKASPTPETTAEPTTSAPAVIPTTSAVQTPTTLVTKTSSAAPVSSSTTSSSDSSKKRGLAYNDADLLSGFLTGDSQVSWAYNWASSTSSIPSSLDYVPILWGMADEFTSVWNSNADASLADGNSYLMSFNEPDYSGQANLEVSAAVSGYMQYMQPYASKAKLGAPAVTNGGSPMGLTYLGNFISGLATAGGSYDFCAIHWYDSATNIDYFKNYMQEASTTCGSDKKLWITEFGATGSTDEQTTFLETVLPWMDSQDYIERYSYFMVTPGNLISSGTTLSALGNTYATYT